MDAIMRNAVRAAKIEMVYFDGAVHPNIPEKALDIFFDRIDLTIKKHRFEIVTTGFASEFKKSLKLALKLKELLTPEQQLAHDLKQAARAKKSIEAIGLKKLTAEQKRIENGTQEAWLERRRQRKVESSRYHYCKKPSNYKLLSQERKLEGYRTKKLTKTLI
jgi:hypothetical protein